MGLRFQQIPEQGTPVSDIAKNVGSGIQQGQNFAIQAFNLQRAKQMMEGQKLELEAAKLKNQVDKTNKAFQLLQPAALIKNKGTRKKFVTNQLEKLRLMNIPVDPMVGELFQDDELSALAQNAMINFLSGSPEQQALSVGQVQQMLGDSPALIQFLQSQASQQAQTQRQETQIGFEREKFEKQQEIKAQERTEDFKTDVTKRAQTTERDFSDTLTSVSQIKSLVDELRPTFAKGEDEAGLIDETLLGRFDALRSLKTSVLREGERSGVTGATGLVGRIDNFLNSLASGQRFNKGQLEQLKALAENTEEFLNEAITSRITPDLLRAERRGVDKKEIFTEKQLKIYDQVQEAREKQFGKLSENAKNIAKQLVAKGASKERIERSLGFNLSVKDQKELGLLR